MAAQPQRRDRNGGLVTVAHLDDAIAAALSPVKQELADVGHEMRGLTARVDAAIERLDRRPLRAAGRWLIHEAASGYRAAVAAGAGATVAALATHFL